MNVEHKSVEDCCGCDANSEWHATARKAINCAAYVIIIVALALIARNCILWNITAEDRKVRFSYQTVCNSNGNCFTVPR